MIGEGGGGGGGAKFIWRRILDWGGGQTSSYRVRTKVIKQLSRRSARAEKPILSRKLGEDQKRKRSLRSAVEPQTKLRTGTENLRPFWQQIFPWLHDVRDTKRYFACSKMLLCIFDSGGNFQQYFNSVFTMFDRRAAPHIQCLIKMLRHI